MKASAEIKGGIALDPNAQEMTAAIFCKTFLGKSENALIRELELFGNDFLDEQINLLKQGATVAV